GVGQVGEGGVEPLRPAGVAAPVLLEELVELALGDAGVAVEVVPLAGDLGAPEAAGGMEPGSALLRTCGHDQALRGTPGYPRKARRGRGQPSPPPVLRRV